MSTRPPGPDGGSLGPVGLVPLGWDVPGPEDLEGMAEAFATIRRLGFAGVQVGDPGPDPQAVRAVLDAADVVPVERYLPIRCDTEGPLPGSTEDALAHVAQAAALGTPMLVAAVDGSPDRDAIAGRVSGSDGPALSRDGVLRLAALLERTTDAARAHGIAVSFHPHAATFIETPEETAALMAAVPPESVGLCLDTGHWIVGGGDPVATVHTYGARITHVHVKDVDAAALDRLRTGQIPTLSAAVHDEVVFCTLGEGVLELEALLDALRVVGYRGWLMAEQDSFHGPAVQAATAAWLALERSGPARDARGS